jgi:hypothetical protein
MRDFKLREVPSDEITAQLKIGLQEMYQEFEGTVLESITEIVDYARALEQDKIDLVEFLFDVLRKRDFADNEHDAAEGLHLMGARARQILTQMGHIK